MKKSAKHTSPMFRQGDVLIVGVNTIPVDARARKRTRRGIVLAEGEVTGHAHAIVEKAVIHFDAPNATDAATQLLASVGLKIEIGRENEPTFLSVEAPAVVRHEEHAPIELAPGNYVVFHQRQWSDAEELIQVAD